MEVLDRVKLSKNLLLLIAGAGLLLILFAGLFIAGSVKTKPVTQKGKIAEVIIDNGASKLRVQRNGVVEISTPDRVVYQFWDQDKVDRLFKLLEQADFSGFDSRLKPGQTGYLLTLTTDQGVITIAIPDESEFIPDIVQELIEILEEVTSQVPEEGGALPPVLVSPTPTPTPTPTPGVSPTPTPTPTPSGNGDGSGSDQVFECEYTGSTEKVRILSETLCDLEQ